MNITDVEKLISKISCNCLGIDFKIKVSYDDKYTLHDQLSCTSHGRIYLQLVYISPCANTGVEGVWKTDKKYLSNHMTSDEVVKKVYVLFEQGVKHEIMEGFKVNNITLFNPHINYEELLKVSHKEVNRS
jgi:hypothetical protein